MDTIIIKNIPFDIQATHLYPILKIKLGSRYAQTPGHSSYSSP